MLPIDFDHNCVSADPTFKSSLEIIEKLNELEELKGAVASLLVTNQDTKAAMKDFVEWFIEFQKESGEVTQGISKSMEDLFEKIKNMQ